MLSFSFCNTVVFTLIKPESTVVVVGFFVLFLPPLEKGTGQGYRPKSEIHRKSILRRQEERDKGHWRK